MVLGRVVGWILFFAGLAILVHDAALWHASGHWAPIKLGQLWYDLSANSLNLAQVAVQRYLWPPLWTGAIAKLLLCWAFAVLIVSGLLLVLAFHRPRPPGPINPRPS